MLRLQMRGIIPLGHTQPGCAQMWEGALRPGGTQFWGFPHRLPMTSRAGGDRDGAGRGLSPSIQMGCPGVHQVGEADGQIPSSNHEVRANDGER